VTFTGMRGRFITFEGGEGAGKSTQIAALAARLRARNLDVTVTREPGGSPGAEIIRHVILSGAAKPLGAEAETILFASAREDHVRATIRPALATGQWVLCDRFADSTRVYQGAAGKVNAKLIRALERVSIGDTRPDLTLILDVPVNVGMARAAARRGTGDTDRFESEATGFHQTLRDGFRALAREEPKRCVLIDASVSVEAVTDAIWRAVEARLGLAEVAPPDLREAMP
jgi:dTMP kinase